MPLEFRRGKDAIEKSKQNSQSSGDFRPFLPNIFWKDDEQKRFLWILNPAEDIPTVKVINPFTDKGRPEYVVSRQDDAIGRSSDPIEDEWGYGPTDNGICVAVELEPINEVTEKGHTRPRSFQVKTRPFERRIRDDDGELTDEKEKVEAPMVGVICQSTMNFFNAVSYRDTNVGPINEYPLEITRLGTGTDTTYNVDVFEEKPLDMDGLLDNWEDISYFSNEDKDALAEVLEDAEDDQEMSTILGNALLDKWLDEHASQEWYDEVLGSIDRVAKFPSAKYKKNNDAGESKSSGKGRAKTERASRPSQRRAKATETEAEPVDEVEAAGAPVVEEPAEEKPKRRGRRKAEPAEEVTKESPVKARLEKIKADNTALREKRKAA